MRLCRRATSGRVPPPADDDGAPVAEVIDDAQLDAMFMALADPTRRAILRRLTEGEASVTELARPFAMSQPAVSKHLKVLERAGLVSRRRDAQRRPCRLEARRLKAATDWLDGYRRYWDESYRRLDGVLSELVAAERLDAGAAGEDGTPP